MKSYVCVDIETTGLSKEKDHIVEIGAVKVENGDVVDEFEQLINPGIAMPYQASMVTGITDVDLIGMPDVATVMPQFVSFCRDSRIVGHNVAFDYGFLLFNAKKLNLKWEPECVDTLKIAKKYLKELPTRKLDYLCEYFGISDENHHRALNDARATVELYELLKSKFKQDEKDNAFAPYKPAVKVKKQSPITPKQKKFLGDLLAAQGLHPGFLMDEMTKSEASHAIDMILSGRGKQL